MAFIQIITFLAVTALVYANEYHGDPHDGVAYSFARFSGPVSGPAHEIHTNDAHHGKTVDYIAKPDYQFEYGVEDPKSHVSQFRKENRQDDNVVGEYSYTDPYGHVRTVKYTAGKEGFKADIYVDGKLETPHVPQAPSSHQAQESDDEGDEDYNNGSESDY